MASATRKEILSKVQKLIPPMLEKFHKGQLGRIAVIGGSEDYTGAPYFSAAASAKLGCDMSHVICEPGAGMVIKTYSPNLMVHPYMRQSKNLAANESIDTASQQVIDMLDRLHVLVIGPGLGRDEAMQETCARVIQEARKRGIAFVLDADGLMLATQRPELVKGYSECILTPNVVEFGRLAAAMGVDVEKGDKTKLCEQLSQKYGGVTVIQKGQQDYISNGRQTLVNDMEGGLKRSGGQGDTLTGSLATLLGYRQAYHDGLWEHGTNMSKEETMSLVAFGGSAVTRECSRRAFKELGRSLQAGDLTNHVHGAFKDVIGEPSESRL
ncbi:MAG: hypothetical protein Q9162_007046 [Coniocarpon cinnabarinum]